MGKLNIAHHKSYHPYRLDNITRVKRDEEQARLKESEEADRALLADSETRMLALRQRAGLDVAPAQVEDDSKPKPELEHEAESEPGASTSTGTIARLAPPTSSSLSSSGNRHINLFEDLEQQSIAIATRASKKTAAAADAEIGVPLGPTKKDLKPWYSSRKGDVDPADERAKEDGRRRRDLARKSHADPLASIPSHITRPLTSSSRSRPSSSSSSKPTPTPANPDLSARLTRESSERARARALIERKRREMDGSVTATPSTVRGGYGDVFNREDVAAAHRGRDSGRGRGGGGGWKDRGWDEDARTGRRRDARW
ncbi:hypothetical protein EVG20_g7218 [Dentipellis fragilis]|uniref:CBF1-interacting co-repressor CIR N-terminal domain-containing protein n=1 Tax=Dentipellis fragilis TaxID=205917 RepID=A0A4Y9YF82_9AGAM|nr:hypothetical protein EVG20_g7218 [Dentipellis fragilis]